MQDISVWDKCSEIVDTYHSEVDGHKLDAVKMTTESADEEPNGKALQCNHCPKTFRYKSEKIRHEMSHSPGFECETCSKKFSFM